MPSLRSHIYALVLRNWHRTAFTSAAGLHRWIGWARQRQNHRPPIELAGRVSIGSTAVDGFPVYRDIGHITDYASYKFGEMYLMNFGNPLQVAQ